MLRAAIDPVRITDQPSLQHWLNDFNHRRLEPSLDDSGLAADFAAADAARQKELQFVEAERAAVRADAEAAPRTPSEFITWFEGLKVRGPGQGDCLFPYLAKRASLEEMVWFLRQEMAGEAGFDDLVALTQVKLPHGPKLELARNYWDEMGRGNEGGMHGPMLERLGRALAIEPGTTVWESLALGNLMIALACNRHYAYQSLGALGVIELTAPGRAAQVNEGLVRLGVKGEARRYFALHATLDVKHSLSWNREVFPPLIASDPRIAVALAEGALMRLNAGARCFARYRKQLGLSDDSTQRR